jgi:hypothetical protein
VATRARAAAAVVTADAERLAPLDHVLVDHLGAVDGREHVVGRVLASEGHEAGEPAKKAPAR